MEAQQLLLIIAVLSFLNSATFTVILYSFNRTNLRTAARQEHNRLLLEIDRYQLDCPDLWVMWDTALTQGAPPLAPAQQKRIELFTILVLNIYETVFNFYHHIIRPGSADRTIWEKWNRMFQGLFSSSSLARVQVADMVHSGNYS
jgi:hypothetical protein